jgi:RNA polymerase sigma factor (sigma-70 family)
MVLESEQITAIFKETYPNLCRFLETIVGRGGSHAQDIAQESFLRLCQAELGQISAPEIRFWLFRVARNLALNELDKGKTRNRLWHHVIDFFRFQEPSPQEVFEHTERQNTVRKLLDLLPEHQRSALLLREQEEMSYREIALILGITESKVKVDIFRARNSLRDLWKEREANH